MINWYCIVKTFSLVVRPVQRPITISTIELSRLAVYLIYLHFSLQDGVNWLAFLNRYKLHGILCDGILL